MYNNHEHFMFVLEQFLGSKNVSEIPRYDLSIGGKLYDITEEGKKYLHWTSQNSTDELLVEFDVEKPIRLQCYCIRKIGDIYWNVLDFQEEVYNNELKQNIIGYVEALEIIYDYDLMELVELACESLKPGYKDGYVVLDLTNGNVFGYSLEDQKIMKPQYLDLYMVDKEMLESNYELYLDDNEIENFYESNKSVKEWLDDNEIDWYSRLIDRIYFSFQDRDVYELWERGVRSSLDNWYSDFYSQHPENSAK